MKEQVRRSGLVLKTLLAVALATADGCGGGGSVTSGVDGTKPLSTLDAAEQGKFCDWYVGLFGGYNHLIICPDQPDGLTFASQADCVQNFSATCAATVTEVEGCARRIVQHYCETNSIPNALASPACAQVPGSCIP